MGKIIGGVIVLLVLVGLVFWWNGKNASNSSMTEKNAPETMAPEQKPADTGMVASIKDAMGLGKKMECTYSSDMNGKTFQSKVVVDGQKFMSTSVVGEMTVYGLFDGETQYTWTSKDKNGFKMTKACLDEFKTAAQDLQSANPSTPKVEDLKGDLDVAKNVSCTPATGGALSVPSDIVFQDQCAMMKQSLEMMKQFKGKYPAGMPTGN